MKLEIYARGIEVTESLRTHVDRHLRFALGRFADRVRQVKVHLTDINGPKGGRDVNCTIRAQLTAGGELVVQELRSSPFTAAAEASDRVARGLARRMERLRQRWKGRK